MFIVFSFVLAVCTAQATQESIQAPSLPEQTEEPMEEEMEEQAEAPEPEAAQSIIDIAIQDGCLITLVADFEAAGLVEVLQGEGPFTVFAPP